MNGHGRTKAFLEACRGKGRVTIDEALAIADGLGLFDDEDPDQMMEQGKKQKIRYLLANATQDGERAMRSVLLKNGRFYVDLFSTANLNEINALIRAENERIARSRQIIGSLRRVKKQILEGQLSLEDVYGAM